MDRHSLTDTQWDRIQPLCLGKKSDPAGQVEIRGCSWKPFYGLRELGAHGATCPSTSVTGTQSLNAFVIG